MAVVVMVGLGLAVARVVGLAVVVMVARGLAVELVVAVGLAVVVMVVRGLAVARVVAVERAVAVVPKRNFVLGLCGYCDRGNKTIRGREYCQYCARRELSINRSVHGRAIAEGFAKKRQVG